MLNKLNTQNTPNTQILPKSEESSGLLNALNSDMFINTKINKTDDEITKEDFDTNPFLIEILGIEKYLDAENGIKVFFRGFSLLKRTEICKEILNKFELSYKDKNSKLFFIDTLKLVKLIQENKDNIENIKLIKDIKNFHKELISSDFRNIPIPNNKIVIYYLPFNRMSYDMLERLINYMFSMIKSTPIVELIETDNLLDVNMDTLTKETNIKKFFMRSLTKYFRSRPGSIFGGAGFGSNFRTLINTKANSTNLRLIKDEIETYLAAFIKQYKHIFVLKKVEYDMSLLNVNKIRIILTILMKDSNGFNTLEFDISPEEQVVT